MARIAQRSTVHARAASRPRAPTTFRSRLRHLNAIYATTAPLLRSIVHLHAARKIQCHATPDDLLACWPREEPLAVIYSGHGPGEHARWTVLARPRQTVSAQAGEDWERACPFLRQELRAASPAPGAALDTPIFVGGWIGWISYDLGREIEPRAQLSACGAERDRDWPAMQWHRCDDALVHDRTTQAWWVVGEGWERVWQGVISNAQARRVLSTSRLAGDNGSRFDLASCLARDGLPRERYIAACERVLEYIRAGDVYQVNLAHRISHTFEGSARAMFLRLLASASPWFGAYVEHTEGSIRQAVCSVSPELLFKIESATGRITTRPMKGTRAPGEGAIEALRQSSKDLAELNMIVDLMRNDLGRVCEVGSVRVERGREVEWHGRPSERGNATADDAQRSGQGILQATATVAGVVRRGTTLADVLRAIVPGGSVTGAPKIRAMQIIDELEPARRGPYCGAIGFVGDDGASAMNVAIRTALIRGRADPTSPALDAILHGLLDYSVGAGIVADSSAEAEWAETLEKARVLRAIRPL